MHGHLKTTDAVVPDIDLGTSSSAELPAGTFVVLALANAIGYLPSTCMPVWVGQVAASLHWPNWSGGALATLQLGSLALGNIISGRLVNRFRRSLAVYAALGAAAGYIVMGTRHPLGLILGSITSGVACGYLLASVNSCAARFRRSQHAFALLQLILVLLGVVLFFSLPRLLQAEGLVAVFIALGGCALIASPFFLRFPSSATTSDPFVAGREVAHRNWAPVAVLFGLCSAIASQTALMACIFEGGALVGLDLPTIGTYMSGVAVLCLLYPLGARLLGDRLGLGLPLVAATLLLAVGAGFIMHAPSRASFFFLLLALMGLPLFILPYALALLASFERAGRWAAIGPGFLMAGVAVGPGLAGMIRAHASLGSLSTAMAAAITGVAITFGLAANAGSSRASAPSIQS